MPLRHVTSAIVAAALAFVAASSGGVAAADDKVLLGGGAGIVVDGTYCTLTTIGHDGGGELVGFTASHCGGPGAQVVAEGTNIPVGSVVAANGNLDYAVIKLDPVAVTPTSNFAGFPINGIGPDPDYHQPACKQGGATGAICSGIGSLPGSGPRMSMPGLFQPGDDGGPVTSDNLLVAMITGGQFLPANLHGGPYQFIHLVKLSAIIADVNAKGGPGAGFSPVPA